MNNLPQSVLAHPVGDAFGHGGRSTTPNATTGLTKQLQQVTAMATLVEATPDYKDQCQQQQPQRQPAVATAVAAVSRSPGMRHALDPPTEQPLVNVFVVDSDDDSAQAQL
jgi:hypothetical protein